MDGLPGVAGMIITSDYGSFPHSLLSTNKSWSSWSYKNSSPLWMLLPTMPQLWIWQHTTDRDIHKVPNKRWWRRSNNPIHIIFQVAKHSQLTSSDPKKHCSASVLPVWFPLVPWQRSKASARRRSSTAVWSWKSCLPKICGGCWPSKGGEEGLWSIPSCGFQNSDSVHLPFSRLGKGENATSTIMKGLGFWWILWLWASEDVHHSGKMTSELLQVARQKASIEPHILVVIHRTWRYMVGIPNVSHLFFVAIDGFRLLQYFNLLPMWGYYGVFAIAKGCEACIFWGSLGSTKILSVRLVVFYFSASWCQPCHLSGTEICGVGQFTSVLGSVSPNLFFGVFTNRNRKEKPMGGGDMLLTSTYYCHTWDCFLSQFSRI